MAYEPVSEDRLAEIDSLSLRPDRSVVMPTMNLRSMIAELRAHRAAALSTDERVALEFARDCVEVMYRQSVREAAPDGCVPSLHWPTLATATIDRLLEGSRA